MTPSAFASWLMTVLGTDKWYEPEQAARAFRLAGAKADPSKIIASAQRAGWLEWHPGNDAFCIPSVCWPRPKPLPHRTDALNQNTPPPPAMWGRGA